MPCNPCWNIVGTVMPCGSSSSGQSSASSCNNGITTTPLGTNSNTGSQTITLTGINCNAGDVLVVAVFENNPTELTTGTCSLNTTSMFVSTTENGPCGLVGVILKTFWLNITVPVSGGTITFTGHDATPGDYVGLSILARTISGLTNTAWDVGNGDGGFGTTNPATLGVQTNFANEFWWGCIYQYSTTSITVGNWSNNFTDGQTVSQNVSGGVMSLNEGYNIVCSPGQLIAGKTGCSQTCYGLTSNSFD